MVKGISKVLFLSGDLWGLNSFILDNLVFFMIPFLLDYNAETFPKPPYLADESD